VCALLIGTLHLAQAQTQFDMAQAPLSGSAHEPALNSKQAPLWWAVSNKHLDKMRGGFDLGQGLLVSFGITRATYINQDLVTSMTLQLGNLNKLTALQVQRLSQQINLQPQVIQNGAGNVVDSGAMSLPLGTYLQNTLNNQVLRTQTVIDINTNGLGMLKNANFQTMMQEAIINALGRR
jgi:hypothetical protein